MPINWDQFDSDVNTAIASASTQTDDKLASQISSITRMTDAEIKELFPSPADVQTLANLMKIVKSSADRNTQINQIVANSQQFGGVILTLLQKFV